MRVTPHHSITSIIPMVKSNFISIQDAAELSKKSVQTIRRAIKSKKLKHRKSKTPQGFNYLINRESLCEIYKLKIEEPAVKEEKVQKEEKVKVAKAVVKKETKVAEKKEHVSISLDDFDSFKKALETMVSNHSEERQNFLRLINTLQEKIFVLENQVNLLQAPKKSWYQIWK